MLVSLHESVLIARFKNWTRFCFGARVCIEDLLEMKRAMRTNLNQVIVTVSFTEFVHLAHAESVAKPDAKAPAISRRV